MAADEDFIREKVPQAVMDDIIRRHAMFLSGKPGGARAVIKDKDLSGLTLNGRNLAQADFTGSTLARCNLEGSDLSGATLFGCDFTLALLMRARLVRADMRGTDMSRTNLSGADLSGADLRQGKTLVRRKAKRGADLYGGSDDGATRFDGANLSQAVLINANAISSNFSDAVLENANLQGAKLQDAVLRGADLSGVNLSSSDIRGADLSYATMVGAKTHGAETNGATLTLTLTEETKGKSFDDIHVSLDEMLHQHTAWIASGGASGKQLDLDGVDMRRTRVAGRTLTAVRARNSTFAEMDLRGMEIQGGHFERADFRKCKLQGADLRGSNFSEALFQRANFSKADLQPLLFSKPDGVEYAIPCSFRNASMRQGIFADGRALECDFHGADLTDADFTNCDLRRADFTGARLNGAVFKGALLDGARFDPK